MYKHADGGVENQKGSGSRNKKCAFTHFMLYQTDMVLK